MLIIRLRDFSPSLFPNRDGLTRFQAPASNGDLRTGETNLGITCSRKQGRFTWGDSTSLEASNARYNESCQI